MNKRTTGTAVAMAIAGLFIAGNVLANTKPAAAPAPTPTKKVMCEGVNSCKGKGSCKGMTNACAGKNGCKGKGMSPMNNAADCTKAGGKVHQS